MENLKDQQIEAQKETIESLSKQVQSLSGELEKCLATVGSTPSALESSNALSEQLYNVITAAFLPITHRSGSGMPTSSKYGLPWWYLRDYLFRFDDLFGSLWGDPIFREGVDLLNQICQATEDAKTAEDFDRFEMAYRLFYSGKHREDHKRHEATLMLILCIDKLRDNFDRFETDIDRFELSLMASALHVIRACQRIWMDAVPEPKEETEGKEVENEK